MSNPNPSPDTRWKKGQSGNPAGRPKGILTVDQIRTVVSKYAMLTKLDLTAKLKDPSTPMLEMMVIGVMLKAYSGGDANRFDFLLNRSIGKVQDAVQGVQEVIKKTVFPDGTEETIEYKTPESPDPEPGE
jgi:hypothetical protein